MANTSPRPTRTRTRPAAPLTLDARALAHELQVHQIELESQNEELRRAQLELAAARDRFIDLYDIAPVGYFTLDPEGRISEANLTGAALLGAQRRWLIGRRFERFIAPPDSGRWRTHLRQALLQDVTSHIELVLQPADGALVHVQLDCLRVAPTDAAPVLRITLSDITQRKLAEMDRRITATVVAASESERRRVARELHENLGQCLSALKMDLAGLPAADADQAQRVGMMLTTLDGAVATVRRISADLRPLMLDDLGLNAAIEWLVRDSAQRLGLAITLRLDDSDPPLGEQTAIALYRMVQEALAHIARHAQASDVVVTLQQRQGELVLTVQDNGSGWPLAAPSVPDAAAGAGASALRLREQAHLLGGRMELGPLRGGGQRLALHLPLPRPPADPAPARTAGGWTA